MSDRLRDVVSYHMWRVILETEPRRQYKAIAAQGSRHPTEAFPSRKDAMNYAIRCAELDCLEDPLT